MAKKPKIHDDYFLETFAKVKLARDVLGSMLPGEVVEALDWETMRGEPETLARVGGGQRRCDRLYSVERRDTGSRVLVYVLLEHRSKGERRMALRMLNYQSRIWLQWAAQHGVRVPLPPIIPVVLSHVRGGWKAPRRFRELFEAEDVDAFAERFVPDVEYLVDDLGRASDEELLGRGLPAGAALALFALRDGRDPKRLRATFPVWARLLPELEREEGGADDIDRTLNYLVMANGPRSISPEELAEMADQKVPGARRVVMNSWERMLESSRNEGREKGREEGREEGQREMLRKLLVRKFGELSHAQMARIVAADGPMLDVFLDRALTADAIGAVLGTDE